MRLLKEQHKKPITYLFMELIDAASGIFTIPPHVTIRSKTRIFVHVCSFRYSQI